MGLILASRALLLLPFSIVVLLGVLHGSAAPVHAATFTVNSEIDEPDAKPGDGQCASTPSGTCTYRAAIMEANAFAGEDTISLPAGTFKTTFVIPTVLGLLEIRSQKIITSPVKIVGAGAAVTVLDSNRMHNAIGLEVAAGTQVSVSRLTIQNAMPNRQFDPFCGAGILNAGTLTLEEVAIRNNSLLRLGRAAGICNSGTLILRRSTLSNNSAEDEAAVSNSGSMSIIDSTISNNRSGDRLVNSVVSNSGTIVIENTAISENSPNHTINSRGATISNTGAISISNSIVTFNGVSHPSTASNCSGNPLTSLGHNTDDDGSCGFTSTGDLSNVPTKLGPLADNGGPTLTHAPLAGSPIIDAGLTTGCPSIDQRGSPRPRDGDGNGTARCDIGAYELQNPFPTIQSFVINAGQGTTNSTSVTLAITASASATQMRFSNDGTTWPDWQALAPQASWTLLSGDGPKTVSAQVRDAGGNASATLTDSIVLDTVASPGVIFINGNAPATNSLSVTLTLLESPAHDGITKMRFSNTNTPDDWSGWEPFVTTKTWQLIGGADGARSVYAQIQDEAGNVSTAFLDTIEYDATSPTVSSLTINQGALATTWTSINLALQASDAGGQTVSQMSFSNDGGTSWSAWETYTTAKSWSLGSGDGMKTVQARVRDLAGNVSAPASDGIKLHTAYGVQYGVSINDAAPYTNSVNVTLSIPAQVGTTHMQVANDGGMIGAPWEPFDTQKSWQIPPLSGGNHARVVYVRFQNANGNVTSIYQDDIILDVNAPAAAAPEIVAPPQGQLVAASPIRTVQLSVSDDISPPAHIQMQLSNRADFAGAIWKPYTSSVTWDFTGGGTIYARFRDGAGNQTGTLSTSLPNPPTLPPSGVPSCSPRPRAVVNLQKANGTLTATLSTTRAGNGIRAVRFDSFLGAIVDVGDQANQSSSFAVSIPAGLEPTTLQFTIRRQQGSPSATVRLAVVDGCGEWSTTLGGGPNAW